MTLYSYIIAFDSGSAPNPFFRCCTLAICKARIRSVAQPGDWIIATGPSRKSTHRKLVYAMRISEVIAFQAYFRDRRFQRKKPNLSSPSWQHHLGDNIYNRGPRGGWRQLPGPHQPSHAQNDLSGRNVLISNYFFYFGANAISLPPSMQSLIHTTQGHRSRFPDTLVRRFINWLTTNNRPGRLGPPSDANRSCILPCGRCQSRPLPQSHVHLPPPPPHALRTSSPRPNPPTRFITPPAPTGDPQ